MKEWAISCLAASVIICLSKMIIPKKGEKGIKNAFNLLSALIMLLIAFSPILKYAKSETDIDLSKYYREYENCESKILNGRTTEIINEKIKELYPNESFSIESVYGNNGEMLKIIIYGESNIKDKIGKSINILYGIKTEVK